MIVVPVRAQRRLRHTTTYPVGIDTHHVRPGKGAGARRDGSPHGAKLSGSADGRTKTRHIEAHAEGAHESNAAP